MTCWPQTGSREALAGLGFGDTMEMLKSTSDAVEKPEQKRCWIQRNHLNDAGKKGKPQEQTGQKKNRRVIQRNNHKPVKEVCPLRTLPKPHRLWQTTIRYKHSRMGWTEDIDFPFDAFSASAETASTDLQTQKSQMWQCRKAREQPKQDFVPQEQKLPTGDELSMFR